MRDNDESAGAARPQHSALGLGERLRSARKARALSVAQAAQALKLSEATIVALEDGRFEELGAPVYIRGHVRRYAELVGLSVDVVLEAYQTSIPANAELPALTRPRLASEQVNLNTWGIWLVVPVLLVLIIALAVRGRGREPQPVKPPAAPAAVAGTASRAPAAAPAGPVADSADSLPAPEAESTTASPPEAAEATPAAPGEPPVTPATADAAASGPPAETAAPSATPAPPATVPAARTRLQLRFADDSFASVTDADRRLLYGLQRRGSRQDLTGRPPLRIVLGNARAVSVSVNGKPFRIPSDAVADNEARFDIGAAGNAPADAPAE